MSDEASEEKIEKEATEIPPTLEIKVSDEIDFNEMLS